MTLETPRRYDFRMIPRELIDPPEIAMRATMDDGKLAELADDIRENGILQPLGVRQVGDRFRISWGHRRHVGAGIAGEAVLPCFVLADDDVIEEQFKNKENRFREDVNPAEEAAYFDELLHRKCGGDIEKLCRLVGALESYVQGRLDLLRGWPFVFDALRAGDVVLGVGRELNKVKDEGWARHWLKDAIEQGMSERAVRTLRMNLQRQLEINASMAQSQAAGAAPSTTPTIATVDQCILCRSARDQHRMQYVKVHIDCFSVLERQAEDARDGAPGKS